MNQKRIHVMAEEALAPNGVYFRRNSLELAKDYVPVLSRIRGANRSIGLASRIEREEEGGISFWVVLEDHLQHESFDWSVYVTGMVHDYSPEYKDVYQHNPVVSKASVRALFALRIKYIPRTLEELDDIHE